MNHELNFFLYSLRVFSDTYKISWCTGADKGLRSPNLQALGRSRMKPGGKDLSAFGKLPYAQREGNREAGWGIFRGLSSLGS